MKKHKIFLYPLEENGKVRVFLFQSGDIGQNRGVNIYHAEFLARNDNMFIRSRAEPQITNEGCIYVNGNLQKADFVVTSNTMTKEQFDKLKELERAYNNR